ncbi:MAG: ROK family protein [Fimbriimonadaceae bacterium]|nr:ROK family protein [Fimbriimonadaceae bacterium]
MQRPCVIGVDLGGTNVRAGAFYEDGSPAGPKFSHPSRAQEGTGPIIEAISSTIQQAVAAAGSPPVGVGMAVPGHIDNAAGLVRWAPNFGETIDGVFRYWENVPLKQPLEKSLDLPVELGNDANLAALGEYRYGTGKNSAKCLVLLTLGTGVGGGVIMSPEAVEGEAKGPLMLVGGNKGGAELGHTIVDADGLDCNAGSYGAIEAYAPRDAIVMRAVHRLRRGRASLIDDLCEGDLSKVTPRIIFEAATQDDELAIQVLAETGRYLGISMGSFINIFAPDVLAVGGQIAKAGEYLLGPARKAARDVAIPSLFKDCEITVAEQIEDAGMLGGAAIVFEKLRWLNR